jgi:N-acetylneuraminic acid mutarotase
MFLLYQLLFNSALSFNISLIPSTGYPPESTYLACMAAISSTLYVFGGSSSSSTSSNTLYSFSFDLMIWEHIYVSSQLVPTPRLSPACFSFNSSLFVFGGLTDLGFNNDLWVYNPNAKIWKLLPQYGNIPPGMGQTSYTLNGTTLYIFGGNTNDGKSSQLYS